MGKYTCPCCGYQTLGKVPPGTDEICQICFWQDDIVQYENAYYEGGANRVSLYMAQKNFKEIGASDKKNLTYVRKPSDEDIFQGPKDLTQLMNIQLLDLAKLFIVTNTPLKKILELYTGILRIKASNLIFDKNELKSFLVDDDINDYGLLLNREKFSNNMLFLKHKKISDIAKLDNTEVDERLNIIEEKFLSQIYKKIAE